MSHHFTYAFWAFISDFIFEQTRCEIVHWALARIRCWFVGDVMLLARPAACRVQRSTYIGTQNIPAPPIGRQRCRGSRAGRHCREPQLSIRHLPAPRAAAWGCFNGARSEARGAAGEGSACCRPSMSGSSMLLYPDALGKVRRTSSVRTSPSVLGAAERASRT